MTWVGTSARRAWTEKEVDGLVFRLLQRSYLTDTQKARFLISQLREQLLKELTCPE